MKTIFLILIGTIFGISLSVFAENFTSWRPSNYQQTQGNNKTAEVQIWCELRTNRVGWENYCRWTGKYWELTCSGVERFFGERIEPINGMYGCEDLDIKTLIK